MKEEMLVLAIRLLPLLFVIPQLVLLRKENKIAKGERSDFSETDRVWMIILMAVPTVLILLLLVLLNAADTFGEFLLVWISVLLKIGILPVLAGAAALALHAQNRKTLSQDHAAQLQEKTRRRDAAVKKRLRVAIPVLSIVAIAIAIIWQFCFPEKPRLMATAYGVYILAGTIWLVWIMRTRDDE